jgi:DNA-directed RNA polymerase specialized sigma54-like protein
MSLQTLGLSQQQRQMMILAPQLRQSLEMLQLPIMELRALIQQEMERNPAIEDVTSPQEVSLEAARARLVARAMDAILNPAPPGGREIVLPVEVVPGESVADARDR